MNDPELEALATVAKALSELSEEQRRNVLLYVNSRYRGQAPSGRGAGHPAGAAEGDAGAAASGEYASLGDFFDAANPQSEADRVLVVAYWLQVVEGASDFESFPVNKHLKNLGHPVTNITRAFDSLISQTPRLILQTSKSGSAKQARKKYKVTREGTKRVQAMIEQNKGGENAS